MEEALVDTFRRETTRAELRECVESFGYKEQMIFNIVSDLIEEGLFIESSRDGLYPADMLQLSDGEIQEVLTYIEEQMNGKEYLCLSLLKGYRRKLPAIELSWNPHLIKTILLANGYRQIIRVNNDYRYDEPIVVRESSDIQSFSDLVYFVLENEYEGQMQEMAIFDFLAEKRIVRPHTDDAKKLLPYEIKHNHEQFEIDEMGFVQLKG